MSEHKEFQEIAHSGGRVTIRIGIDEHGRRQCQLEWHHQRPVAAAMFGVYALPQGVAVSQLPIVGMGAPVPPPPIPGCYQVFIGSDSEGKFGHQCPSCRRYWRGDAIPAVCPYCGIRAEIPAFLSDAQRRYVQQFCQRMSEALMSDVEGDYIIDLDAVADSVGKEGEKPPFYYSEERQQKHFTCDACGTFNDILGTFGYCQSCGTRNDVQEFAETIIPKLRERINSGEGLESCVKDAVSAFDALVGRLTGELLGFIPLSARRKAKFENRRFHDLESVIDDLRGVFDINIVEGLPATDVGFAKLMFYRRHVYEHKGGEADEKYIAESGDSSIRPRQALKETQESAHQIASLVVRMATNLQRGFHELLPPLEAPIRRYERWAKPKGSPAR